MLSLLSFSQFYILLLRHRFQLRARILTLFSFWVLLEVLCAFLMIFDENCLFFVRYALNQGVSFFCQFCLLQLGHEVLESLQLVVVHPSSELLELLFLVHSSADRFVTDSHGRDALALDGSWGSHDFPDFLSVDEIRPGSPLRPGHLLSDLQLLQLLGLVLLVKFDFGFLQGMSE